MAARNSENRGQNLVAKNVEKVTRNEWINEGFRNDEEYPECDHFEIGTR